MTNDLINGLFELGGAIAILLSIRAIVKDKCYAGLSPLNLIFFTTWSTWNLYYYPSLDQIWSFVGGCAITFSNAIYLFCVWYFPHHRLEVDDIPEEDQVPSLSLGVGKKYRDGYGTVVTILESPNYLLPGEFLGSEGYTYFPDGRIVGLFNYDSGYILREEVIEG